MRKTLFGAAALLLSLTLLFAACGKNDGRDLGDKLDDGLDKVSEGASMAGDKLRDGVTAVSDALDDAGDKLSDAVSDAGERLDENGRVSENDTAGARR